MKIIRVLTLEERKVLCVPNYWLDDFYSDEPERRNKARIYLCLLKHVYFADGEIVVNGQRMPCRKVGDHLPAAGTEDRGGADNDQPLDQAAGIRGEHPYTLRRPFYLRAISSGRSSERCSRFRRKRVASRQAGEASYSACRPTEL